MGKIQKLTPELIGKIAAGEVVERPAAAIKELVENSMDAGASAITIEIKEGGISYFRVTDNGSGIPQEQIRMAFERHATSKIDKEEDLYAIATLGFRGEALASIAAVSQVTCTTRTEKDSHGIKIVNQGGHIVEVQEASSPQGTTFVVENLFFNTPVRLKFLKKPAYEAGLVADFVMRLILSRPDISFRFINQGKTVYHSPGDGKIDSAIYSIYGKEMLESMRYIKGAQNGMAIEGYIGIGDSARGNRNHQSFFINGRYMKSLLLSQGLEQGARERVTIGHFPTCVLYITMNYDKVDVNVHPNKLEVRFQNEMAILEGMRDLVQEALVQDTPLSHIPQMTLVEEKKKEGFSSFHQVKTTKIVENAEILAKEKGKENKSTFLQEEKSEKEKLLEAFSQIGQSMGEKKEKNTLVFRERSYEPPLYTGTQTRENHPLNKPLEKSEILKEKEGNIFNTEDQNLERSSIKETIQETFVVKEKEEDVSVVKAKLSVIGVVFKTYILVEYVDQLLLIDQHAAHERLLYDELMEALDRHTGAQQLLVPQVISLTFNEKTTLHTYKQPLEEVGFQIEDFGENTIQLRAVPVILGQPQAKNYFLEILDEMENKKGLSTVEKRRSAIIQMACKRAVKGGENLPMVELESIVEELIEKGVTPTCPHGRPLVVAITQKELEKRFKRIQ